MRSPARSWREHPQRYRLEAAKCKQCGKVMYPPRLICPACRSKEMEPVKLPLDGKIVTYTVINVPPAPFSGQAPLVLAVVELDDGTRTMMQVADVADLKELKVGMRVRLQFRRISEDGEAGLIFYGHKATPA